MKRLEGKVAVVTGAGSGIGRALAVQLADRGCRLAIADVDTAGLEETHALVSSVAAACSQHVVDVSEYSAVRQFAAAVIERHGGAELLINNAGVTLVGSAQQVSIEDYAWIMDVNFWGVVHGTKAFLPHLRTADEAHIVNISSVLGLVSMPLQTAYSASKFAVRGFTEALKMELAGSRVGVSCVHPGGVRTRITRNARIVGDELDVTREQFDADFDRAAVTTPDAAAAAIIRGVEKAKRRVLIGPDARIMDLASRLFPGSYERFLGLEKEARRRAKARAEADA